MAKNLDKPASPLEAKLTEFVKYVDDAEEATIDAREQSEKCRDYFDSKQLTDEEVAKLTKRKQPPIVNNRIKPKVNTLIGMEKQARTSPKAYPRTPKHEDDADAATEALRYVLDKNKFDAIRSAVFENMIIEGSGAAEILVKERNDGEFEITISHIQWDRMFFDPKSRSKSFTSDCRYKGQIVWMDWQDAVDKFPESTDYLEATRDASGNNGGSNTYDDKPVSWVSGDRRRVKIVEMSYKESGKIYDCVFTKAGFLVEPAESPFLDEDGEQEDRYEFQSAYVSRDNDRYGEVQSQLDLQDEVNKRRSKALHLMNVRQTYSNKGSVSDTNKFRTEASKPDGHLEGDVGEFGKDFGVVPTGDMAAAHFQMLQEAKAELDATSVNAALTGAESRDLSGIALKKLAQGSQLEVGPLFDSLRDWQLRVYRKVWNRIRQYWTEEKWVRVTDEDKNIRWVGINRPMTLAEQMEQEGQEIPPEMQGDPRLQEVVGTAANVAELDVDIILDEMPDMVNQQQEEFQTLVDLAGKAGNMPPPLFIAMVKASSLRNKDDILKQLQGESDIPPEVKQQMDKMKMQIDQMGQAMQELQSENETMKMDKSGEQQKLQADQQKMGLEVQGRGMDLQMRQEELQFEREKMEFERDRMHLEAASLKVEKGEEGFVPMDPLKAIYPVLESQHNQVASLENALMKLVQLQQQVLMAVSDRQDMQVLAELQRQTLMVVSAPKQVEIKRTKTGFEAVSVPNTGTIQ